MADVGRWKPDFDLPPPELWRQFYEFAWRFLKARPPRVMRMVPEDNRDDYISEVILHCARDDFRVLRKFDDQGVPFSAWFTMVARNKILSLLKYRKPKPDGEDTTTNSLAAGTKSRGESGTTQTTPAPSTEPTVPATSGACQSGAARSGGGLPPPKTVPLTDEDPPSRENIDEDFSWTELLHHVQRAINGMGQLCQLLLRLAAEDPRPRVVAASASIPVKDVYTQLPQCRRKLRTLLREAGIDPDVFS